MPRECAPVAFVIIGDVSLPSTNISQVFSAVANKIWRLDAFCDGFVLDERLGGLYTLWQVYAFPTKMP